MEEICKVKFKNDCYEDVTNYLKKYLDFKDNSVYAYNETKRLGLDRIVLKEFKGLDENIINNTRRSILYQKILNNIILQDLTEVIDQFNKNDIEFVILKGLPLAQEIYNAPEVRKTTDIDIFISPKYFIRAISILKDIGYCEENGRDIEIDALSNFLQSPFPQIHYRPLIKKLTNRRKVLINIEVHTNLINKESFNVQCDENFVSEVMKRSKKVNFYGKSIKILSLYDNIIFLLSHFVKHFYEPILNGFFNGNTYINLQLNLLYDVALLIDKYYEIINWQEFKVTLSEWKIEKEVAFVLNIFNEIFPNRMPSFILETSTINGKGRMNFIYRASELLSSWNVNEFIFNKDCELVSSKLVREITKNNGFSKCEYSENLDINEIRDFIVIDEYNKDRRNGFNTHCIIDSRKPKSSLDCSAKVKFCWNEDYFRVVIKILDNDIIFSTIDEDVAQDYIRLCIDTMNREEGVPLARTLYLQPVYNKSNVEVLVLEDIFYKGTLVEEQRKWNKEEYRYYMDIYNQGYTITLDIPWNKLSLKPKIGASFNFDIVIYDFDREGNKVKLHTVMSWVNSQQAWYDVSTYGMILLN